MKTKSHETFAIPYENLDDIPLYEFEYWHRAYWNFVANNKFTSKPLVFNSSGKSLGPVCFACAFRLKVASKYPKYKSLAMTKEKGTCDACPLGVKTSGNWLKCISRNSPYYWFELFDVFHIPIISKLMCSYFARKVAKLKWTWQFSSLNDSQDTQTI